MTATLARVLLLGTEPADLQQRAALLSHFWTTSTVAVSVYGAADQPMPMLDDDLVIVCETLPEPERQVWVDRIREEAPRMLIVRINGFDSGPLAGADATVDFEHGPGALVTTVFQLLTERGIPSRSWPEDGVGAWIQ